MSQLEVGTVEACNDNNNKVTLRLSLSVTKELKEIGAAAPGMTI